MDWLANNARSEERRSLDDFFTIYDCRVDEWSSEDLVEGDIDGVSVKFSDFYAVKKVKKKKRHRDGRAVSRRAF